MQAASLERSATIFRTPANAGCRKDRTWGARRGQE